MPDYAPSFGKSQALTYIAGAAITGGQVLAFSAADTVVPTAVNPANFAGIAGHDAATGSPITVHAGAGLVHETPCGLAAPAAVTPSATTTGGTTVVAGTYLVAVTYINAAGETTASPATPVTVSGATGTITIPSPPANAAATGWGAYISQPGSGVLWKQGGSQTIGTPLVLTTAPGAASTNPPGSNASGPAAATLVYAAAAGLVSATAGSSGYGLVAIGVSVRATNAAGLLRWKSLVG